MNVPFFDMPRVIHALKKETDAAIDKVIASGNFINGNHVKSFEMEFAKYIGTKYCMSCGNGTDAIEIALAALGIQTGDEVIVPNHTWTSTASAVVNIGAIPIFSKSSATDYTIDCSDIIHRINNRTKAIIGVHLYGNPCNVIALQRIAKESNLFFIEDCAQAHGAEVNGQKVGSFGDISTFSFYPSKNLGCFGDGGCITTNNSDYARTISYLKNCGQVSKNNHVMPGRNSRMDEIQAAILSVKLPYLNEWNQLRIEHANFYKELLNHPSFLFQEVSSANKCVYHVFSIRTKRRNELKSFLDTKSIGTGIHYPNGLSKMAFYQTESHKKLEDQEYIDELLSLPMFPFMTENEIKYVCEKILEFETK